MMRAIVTGIVKPYLILLGIVLAGAVFVDVTASVYHAVTGRAWVCNKSGGIVFGCRMAGR